MAFLWLCSGSIPACLFSLLQSTTPRNRSKVWTKIKLSNEFLGQNLAWRVAFRSAARHFFSDQVFAESLAMHLYYSVIAWHYFASSLCLEKYSKGTHCVREWLEYSRIYLVSIWLFWKYLGYSATLWIVLRIGFRLRIVESILVARRADLGKQNFSTHPKRIVPSSVNYIFDADLRWRMNGNEGVENVVDWGLNDTFWLCWKTQSLRSALLATTSTHANLSAGEITNASLGELDVVKDGQLRLTTDSFIRELKAIVEIEQIISPLSDLCAFRGFLQHSENLI